MDKISVIIANYNKGKYLKRIVNTLSQSNVNIYEVIIVDDASNDNSIDYIQKLIQERFLFYIRLFQNNSNLGAAASRNRGIEKSNGNCLLFIDSDAYFSSDAIEKLFVDIQNFDISFPKALYEDGSIINPKNDFEKERVINSMMFVIKKKSLYKMDMYFDELMQIYAEDADFFLRAHALGLKAHYVEDAVVYHPVRNIFSEISYYHRLKNVLYMSLKLHGLVEYRISFWIYSSGLLYIYFLTALFNRHFDGLVPTEIRYDSTRLKLLKYYFKAIYWNLKRVNIISISLSRKKLKGMLLDQKFD